MHQLNRKEVTCELKKLDKYYTNLDAVRDCLKHINLNAYDLVIEPSAGAGAFYNTIKHPNKIGMDIKPADANIETKSWFDYQVPYQYKKVLIIGNPPFGQYHSLSKAFIQHALTFNNTQTIAFILPNVYKKYTRQTIIPKDYRIKHIVELKPDSFTLGEDKFNIPSSFFIIDKSEGEDLRAPSYKNIHETEHFTIVKPNKEYDLFMFGASPKTIIRKAKSNNRGYCLRSKIGTSALKHNLQQIIWEGNSSASGGVYWLNKAELLHQYNQHHKLQSQINNHDKI